VAVGRYLMWQLAIFWCDSWLIFIAAMSCPPFNPPPFGHPLKRGKGGHLWLRFFLSFPLDRKGPKGQGRHQRPCALGGRPSAMSAVARAPSPGKDWRSRTRRALLLTLAVIADLIRDLLRSSVFQNPIFQHYIRQQTTTNNYCRLQTFNQRIGLDKFLSFAT